MSKCAACPASAYCLIYGPGYMEKYHKICENCGRIYIYSNGGSTGTFNRKFLSAGSLCNDITERLPTLDYYSDARSSLCSRRLVKCAHCYLKKKEEHESPSNRRP